MATNLSQRIFISAVFGPALLALFWLGDTVLVVALMVITALGVREFCMLQTHRGRRAYCWAAMFLCAAWVVVVHLYATREPEVLYIGLALGLLGFLPVGDGGFLAPSRLTLRGFGYVGFLGGFSLLVHDFAGPELTILVLLGIWVTDSSAYFSGRKFGRFHPFPNLSPGKTVAGFIGGLLGGIVTGVSGWWTVVGMSGWFAFGLGCVVGVGSLVGDLAESKLKRDAGVKDTSALIPGHGGVLDRFDSFLFVFPLIYVYLMVLVP